MKKITVLTCVLMALLFTVSSCSSKKSNPWLKSGSYLNYHLTGPGMEYDFNLSNLVIDKEVAFAWEMTEPMNYKGKLKMTEKALNETNHIENYFSDGQDQIMDDRTTVWFSKKLYNGLNDKKESEILIDGATQKLNFKSKEKYKIKIDDTEKEIEVLFGETNTGGKFWILDDPKNPLIVKMEIEFTIELKSVKTK